MNEPTKRCTKCPEGQNVKPISQFYKSSKNSSGLRDECKECTNTVNNRWKEAHPEKAAQYNRTSYSRFITVRRAAARQYASDHQAQRKITWERFAETHQQERRVYRRHYVNLNRVKVLLWMARRVARRKALPDTFTEEQQTFMLQYWSFSCAVCGNQEGFQTTLALDHWIPLAAPACPGTVATNILPLCHTRRGIPGIGPGCNNTKNATDSHAWLLKRFGPRKAARIEKAIATYFAIVAERFSTHEGDAADD